MVNALRSRWLMIVGGAVFLCANAFGQNCSVATLKGSYGIIQRGTIPGGATIVSVGLVVFDGQQFPSQGRPEKGELFHFRPQRRTQ